MSATANNLQDVRQRIRKAVEAAQREEDAVKLIAVTKTFPAFRVVEAMEAGQSAFGENYVQEAVAKMGEVEGWVGREAEKSSRAPARFDPAFEATSRTAPRSDPALEATSRGLPRSDPAFEAGPDRHSCGVASPPSAGPLLRPAEWHFIGPIQSNKTRTIAARFDWVHCVDRLRIAERLSAQRDPVRGALNVLLEVNLDGEANKSGVSPDRLQDLAQAVVELPRLRLRGLMAVPEARIDPAEQRAAFARLRMLGEQLRAAGLPCEHLSMGMSADLEAAIAEGATMIRVGTAIFGARTP